MNKLNYGTWTGKVDQTAVQSPAVLDTYWGETRSLEDFRGKYLLLDCWSTTCGYCYRAFPEVQALYDKYKDNPGISIMALHCRYTKDRETYATGSQILKREGYSFPCLSVDMENPLLLELKVQSFPIVLIFNSDTELVFRGDIKGAVKFIDPIMADAR